MIEAKLGPCGVQRRCERECSKDGDQARQKWNHCGVESGDVWADCERL